MGFFCGLISKAVNGTRNAVKKVASTAVSTAKRVGSAVVSAGKSAYNKVSKTVKAAAIYAKEKAKEVKSSVTNTWNKFTGKADADKAKELYEKIERRYNDKCDSFKEEISYYSNRIENRVESINRSKAQIKQNLFPRFAELIAKIVDIEVEEGFTLEKYAAEEIKVDKLRAKTELITIDFDKDYWKNTFKAVFTLGFATRKAAKESLLAVQEEEKKINVEIAKMDAELVRVKNIDKALENIEHYFDGLLNIYESLLHRLDHAVNTLYVRCLTMAHKFLPLEMSVRKLTKMQQKELEAILTTSNILKEMVNLQLVSATDDSKVSAYSQKVKTCFDEVNREYLAA